MVWYKRIVRMHTFKTQKNPVITFNYLFQYEHKDVNVIVQDLLTRSRIHMILIVL